MQCRERHAHLHQHRRALSYRSDFANMKITQNQSIADEGYGR
jgi:hypothetical protein